MKTIPELTDSEILAAIAQLQSPAYQNLSRTHSEYLEALEAQARTRNLKS